MSKFRIRQYMALLMRKFINFLSKTKIGNIIIFYVLFYILEFFIIPIFLNIEQCYFYASYISLTIPIIFILYIVFFISEKIYHYVIGCLIYDLCVYVYNANGLYGIGVGGFLGNVSYDTFWVVWDLTIQTVVYLLIQFLALILKKIFKRILKFTKNQ